MEKERRKMSPEQDALEHIVACRDKPFLEERFIDFFKGRGVFTHKAIKPSTFVVEYRGNIFSHEDTSPKKKCDTLNKFLFRFSWKGAQWCVDASKEDGTLGRLVNDDHVSPNCEMKTVVCEGKPHLCLFAVTEISPGEEITYNYGDSCYPWRSNMEDSSASNFENPCSGDDGDKLHGSGPSHGMDSFGDINCQLDFRDSSPFANLDSSQEMTGTFMLQPDNALYNQQEDEAASSSKEHKGPYGRKEMWRHEAKCPSSTSNPATGGKTRVLGEIALAELPLSKTIPSAVRKMLLNMKQDEIASAVQNDFLLIQLAQNLSEKHGNNPSEHIRQKLREMGRLLLALHEKSIFSFEDAIKPENFSKVVEAVKDLAGFDEKTQIYNKPSLAFKLGHSLKKIGTIVLTGADCNEQMRDTKTFMKLCAKEWSQLVSQTALASLSGRRVNNPSTVLFTQDVQLFFSYLETTTASAIESMEKYESQQVYNALCKVTLAQASVFSQCAPEVSKMTLKTFQERGDSTQVLSKHFIRINIPSRTGQNVALLLTSALVSAITLLVNKREACGVHKDNPFLFAKPDSSPTSVHQGMVCIRAFSILCGAKNPEHLRAMHLHKHIARVFQVLYLENDELDKLGKLLGLDIRADRDYYRLPEATVELAKIAKLILAMEKGSLERFEGNSLDQIEIEEELEPDEEHGNPKNSDAEEDIEESDNPLHQNDAAEHQDRQLTPEQDALEHIKGCRDKLFLEERFIDPFKGRGVFTHQTIEPSTFVVEFRGNIVSHRQTRKKCGDTLNNYVFDFSWNGTNWHIDAANEDGTLGRLVNDDHVSPNCEMKKVVCEGKPHLCLFAVTEISPGQEITYNYGDSCYPWRSTESCKELNTSQTDVNAASSPEDECAEDSAEASSSASSCWDEDYVPSPRNNRQSFTESDSPDDISSDEELKEPSFTNINEEDLKDHSFTKRNYCYVCGVAQSKISRHLFTHRNEEPDIAAVLRLRKNSKERKALLEKLRDKGNTKHNEEVLKTRCGQLKLKRNPSTPNTAKSFASCVYCKSMYIRKDVWRHMLKCSARKSAEPQSHVKTKVLTLIAEAESTDTPKISSDVRKMFNTMKNDEISSEILNDSFLLQLARCLYCMNRRKKKNVEDLKKSLRQIGRLLLILKKKAICSFEDAIKPQNFRKVVEGVRELSGFKEETKFCDRPNVLKKMGNLLMKIGEINFARALKDNADKKTIRQAEKFIKLCAKEWRNVPPSKTQLNTTPTIPFIHDVQLFYQCMEKTAASAVQSLTMYASSPVYTALLRVTLAQVSVLNTNMAQVSKATLKSFKEQDETELHEDAAVSQSQVEQILSKHNVKINIKTENDHKVAVTLTSKMLAAVTLLVNKRDACGVHENNPFLFARPNAPCSSFHRGYQCTSIFAARCGAKNPANLRSLIFHKHLVRFFQILSLTNDELDQLAKLLGRDIQTDREYYQTPEAAVDIAKISELLSAMENGSLKNFEGKSFEEIEIPDELEPDVLDNSENSDDDEEDNEKSDSSLLLSGLPIIKGSLWRTKKPRRASMLRRRSRGRNKKQESEPEGSELVDEKDKEVNTERDDWSEEMPVSCAVNPPEKTVYCSNEDATHISFSDGDDDMNVDFDMDTDDDIVRNEENDEDGDKTGSAATSLIPDVMKQDKDSGDTKNDSSPYKDTSVAELEEETMNIDTDNNEERRKNPKKGGKLNDWIDVDSRSFSDFLNTEKKNKLSAALIGMKEVKILIPKLDIEKFQFSGKRLSSECKSVKSSVKDRPIHEDNNQCPTSSTATDVQNKPNYAKASKMNCSHCKKCMMKGQTAYQKKGFTEVFCSKNCLFEIFPVNKPVSKTCHYCLKGISRPLDLIMAVVDIKGTMKDFCSTTCLLCFKSNTGSTQTPQRLCSMCHKSCTIPQTTCEMTLNEAVHTFCSDFCLEDFRKDNMAVCENCSSNCSNKPLKLELKAGTKTICSQECLDEFKEKIETLHQCTMCHTSQTITEMVAYKNEDNVVKLFCNSNCMTSYKLQPAIVYKLQEKESTGQLKRKKGKQSKQQLNPTEVKISKDSTLNENDAPAAAELDSTSRFIIEASCVACCNCGEKLSRGEKHYQPKNSLEVFCSAKCLSERHPHSKLATKNCYNCFQEIMRPHDIILAPVDDSGTMKELCSEACLASVNAKRKTSSPKTASASTSTGLRSECKMCAKYCYCKFRMTLDGLMQRICSKCFINNHRINNLPGPMCDVCGSHNLEKRILLTDDEGSKIICSEECLIEFKEKVQAPQLCPMCQTYHRLSDMVEETNDKGTLDFYCSNRCMMVHKAQSSTVAERISLSPQENDIKDVKPSISPDENDIKEVKPSISPEENDNKEVKPSIPNLGCIKEEPMDEEYNQNLPSSISTENIKDEPKAGDDVAKEHLKIGSVFSLTGDLSTPTSTAPTPTCTDLPASCSNCKQVLKDGETVYQRKGHADIFCSSPCLLKFYQMKQVKKTCHFCLQGITPQQNVIQALVENEGTRKDFCSQSCLSSFSYKTIVSTKIPLVPVASQSQCSMCSRFCISKHEIIQKDVVHKICSNPCFLRFCNMNNLSICENCRSPCKTPVTLKIEDGSKKLCDAECLAQFKQKIKTLLPCVMCRTAHLMTDMFENKNSEDVVELFCTSSCVMASKIQAVSASGTPLDCDHCGKTTLPACHLAMSDASIRNFCTLTCAMSFKESQKDMAVNSTGAADQTQCDFLKPPEKLPCAQCGRILKASPKVIQKKGKIYFVCGQTCSQEFNRVNNITGKCEYCNNERIIRHVRKFDGKDCDFCSDGCKMLFQLELEKKWGKHCGWCAYCVSFSKAVVTAKYEGAHKDFCSEDCSSNYKRLLFHAAKCDTCGRISKLGQSLPMLGEVKRFCDLRCLLHFCNKKVQLVNTVSTPPRSSGTVESFPVIANVISLASTLAKQSSTSASSAQHGQHTQTLFPVSDIQTKVVGHASVQTVPKELKNKSMLCTPLVHNKGVSCTTQTVDSEAQTENFVPKVIVLPVPVPVYIPLPMNMYSQYTPVPLGLPLPLPVPVFLPDPTVKSMKEMIHPDPLEGELNFKFERKKVQDEKKQREHIVKTKEGRRQKVHAPKEHSSNDRDDLDSDHQATFNNQKDLSSDSSFESLSQPNTQKKTPRFLEAGMHSESQPELPPPALEMRGDPQGSPSAETPPMLLQQTGGKVHNKNKGRKLHQSPRAAKEEVISRKYQNMTSQCGIAAWKRWIQWRKSQTNLDLVSNHVGTLNEEVLCCSASELSDSLCCFIAEVKRPDGEPYSPDRVFFLCLSIQQYLFENGRMENIFSDLIYDKFSTKFNKILKGFKPSISASGYIHSRVEEEFLWDCKQLGAYSPIVLLNTLLFFCCKYFGFTTVEQHRQLSFAHVMRCTKTNQNNTKTTFLRFYPPTSIKKAKPDADGIPAKKRKKNESREEIQELMENTENPLRCPVRLYEFYLSKCSESLTQRTDLFYLSPDGHCVPTSPLWFSSTPLDDRTMEAMLVRILAVRELCGEERRGVDQQMSDDTWFIPDEEDLE